MAKSSRPASAILDPERGCVLSEPWAPERLRLRYCCSSLSIDVGRPSMTIMPRRGRPSALVGRMTRSLNFGLRYVSKRSGGSMLCMSQSTNLRPSFMISSDNESGDALADGFWRPLPASGGLACGLAQQCAACFGGHPVDAGACGEEEDAPILAPGQIRWQLRQDNASQPFAIWAAHPHAARSGAEHVTVQVDLEAVRHARVLRR